MRGRRASAVIFLVAVLAYLPGFWWGAPSATAADRTKAWGVDDEPPMGPLGQLHDLVTPGTNAKANLGYPMLHPFVVFASFAPYLGYLRATRQLAAPTPTYPFGFSDPATALRILSVIAHFLSVVLAAGIVVAAYDIGRVLWSERDGRLAAMFALLGYPMFYYARTSNVDVPVLFFSAWALAAFARCLALGVTLRRGIALGAMVGLAAATKEPSVASFVAVPLVLMLVPAGASGRPWRQRSVILGALAAAACAAAAYAVGSGLAIDPQRWLAHIAFARQRVGEDAAGTTSFVTTYPHTLAGNLALMRALVARLADAMTLPAYVLSFAGFLACVIRRDRAAWLMVTCLTYLLILVVAARVIELRYLMPVAFTLAVYAGHAVAAASHTASRGLRVAGLATAAAAVLVAGLWGADLTDAMLRDSRYRAGAWLAKAAHPGDTLDSFGANPPMPAYLASRAGGAYLRGHFHSASEPRTAEWVRDAWREHPPRFIALMPDYTSKPGDAIPETCPPAIFDDLEQGRLGYVRVALFETPTLLRWARRPALDYPSVNPPIRIYVRRTDPLASTPAP